MRWLLVVALAAGCTSIYGLRHVDSVDQDNDGVNDDKDNCPTDYNPDQSDFDHNGKGDACDLCTNGGSADVDHDGIPDGCDGCIGNGMDVDHDHIDDACDTCINTYMDVDQDGIDDGCDPCIGQSGVDADHDGIDDACDQCQNTYADVDQDGIDDGCDPCITTNHTDADGDGIEDACDACISTAPKKDLDNDGVEDACDPCICSTFCANPTNHDEDRDGIDDGCDNCKMMANPDQADTTDVIGSGDGVGDKCDLGSEVDHEVFDAFTSEAPEWYVQGVGWTLQPDEMAHVGGESGFRMLGTSAGGTITSGHFRVSTIVELAAQPGNGEYVDVRIGSTQAMPAPSMASCGIVGNGALAAPSLVLAITRNGVADPPIKSVDFNVPLNTQLLLTLDNNGSKLTCSYTTLPPLTSPMTIQGTSITGTGFYTGISAAGPTARFHAFDVVTQ